MADHQEFPRVERLPPSDFQQPSRSALEPMASRSVAAGWYPDPYAVGQLRWWDGLAWGPLQPPATPGPAVVVQTNVAMYGGKSVGAAFALTFFFGPLGLFYASVVGGLVMLAVCIAAFFLSFFLFGIPSFLAWVGCIVWGCSAAGAHNSRVSTFTATRGR